jgi:hypothetical protein
VRAAIVGRTHPGAEVTAFQAIQHRHEIRAQDAQRIGDLGLVASSSDNSPSCKAPAGASAASLRLAPSATALFETVIAYRPKCVSLNARRSVPALRLYLIIVIHHIKFGRRNSTAACDPRS